MEQHPLFNLDTGEALRERGLDRVEGNELPWVERARLEAENVALRNGTVTTDDLRWWADRSGNQPDHPNAWGAVFRGSRWRAVSYAKSRYVSNHARRITVWELADA